MKYGRLHIKFNNAVVDFLNSVNINIHIREIRGVNIWVYDSLIGEYNIIGCNRDTIGKVNVIAKMKRNLKAVAGNIIRFPQGAA